MRITEENEKLQYIDELRVNKKYYGISTVTGKKIRYAKEDGGTMFVYAANSSRRGYRMTLQAFLKSYDVLTPKYTAEEQWHRDLKKAVQLMEESWLWPDIKEMFSNLLTVSLDDRQEIADLYWQWYDHKKSRYNSQTGTLDYSYDAGWENPFVEWAKKYPFMFYKNKDGIYDVNSSYIYGISDCKLKTMYFGSRNAEVKDAIEEALKTKTAYNSGLCDSSYDVSFSYDPDKNKAWYSEEYKGCGNGHYYIALNKNTALFVEDD